MSCTSPVGFYALLGLEIREIIHIKYKKVQKRGRKVIENVEKKNSRQKFWATKKLVSEIFSHNFDFDENIRELIISTLRYHILDST